MLSRPTGDTPPNPANSSAQFRSELFSTWSLEDSEREVSAETPNISELLTDITSPQSTLVADYIHSEQLEPVPDGRLFAEN